MNLHRHTKEFSRHPAELLECASPLALLIGGACSKAAEDCRTPRRKRGSPITAFTLTELLVVITILTLLAATQLPALTGGKAPVGLTQCMNNLRQIGQATQLYMPDNNDCYPHGDGHTGSVTNPLSWTMQLLRYMGTSTNLPVVYRCPSENSTDVTWDSQVHYVANALVTDVNSVVRPVSSSQIRRSSIYWLFMEKSSTAGSLHIRPGGLANPILAVWNSPPGYPGLRRHNGGFTAMACDGHVDWLRPPPYRPGAPPPSNFAELGDTSDGMNPASTWVDSGLPKKLFCRKRQALSAGGIAF